MLDYLYPSYRVHPELQKLFDRINPPEVSIEDGTECTVVKVDSRNKHGILLELVQILTDLDLIISKSYISSDGGWFMDVFHVTDKHGSKLTDPDLVQYIQQAIRATRESEMPGKMTYGMERELKPIHTCTESTAIEVVGRDSPGLMHDISSLLFHLGCHINAALAWTHKKVVACIFYVEDAYMGEAITDPERLSYIEEDIESLMGAIVGRDYRRRVSSAVPSEGRTHTERRLHQLMYEGRDFETCRSCGCSGGEIKFFDIRKSEIPCYRTHVKIENCEQKQYTIVNIRSKDRPKLLFDTVCALKDMQYDVIHAAVRSNESIAYQEYFIRHKHGHLLDLETEGQNVTQCLIASIERRVSHGMRLDISIVDRMALLLDMTTVLLDNGLSITRSELRTRGDNIVGSLYVTCTLGHDVILKTIEILQNEVGGTFMMVQEGQEDRVSVDESESHGLFSRIYTSLINLLTAMFRIR